MLLCSGSDGLLKLWTIKNNECVKTFDEHKDKVWALATSSDEKSIITGAGDSNIIVWKVSRINSMFAFTNFSVPIFEGLHGILKLGIDQILQGIKQCPDGATQ